MLCIRGVWSLDYRFGVILFIAKDESTNDQIISKGDKMLYMGYGVRSWRPRNPPEPLHLPPTAARQLISGVGVFRTVGYPVKKNVKRPQKINF